METSDYDEYYYTNYVKIINSQNYIDIKNKIQENCDELDFKSFEYQTYSEDIWPKIFELLFEICKTDTQRNQLYDYWCKEDKFSTTPFILHLFFDKRENTVILKKIVDYYGITCKNLYFDLINSTNNDFDVSILEKIDQVYGNQPDDFWMLINSSIIDDESDANYKYYIKPFINMKIGKADKPKWVLDFKLTRPKNMNLINLVANQLYSKFPNSKKIESMFKRVSSELIFEYRIMTIAQKADLIDANNLVYNLKFMNNEILCYAIEIFRLKGPNNQNEKGENFFMFDCKQFTGECECCKSKIEKLNYSLREPLIQGGWGKFFCSFDCLSQSPTMERYPKVLENLKYQIETIYIQE